MKENMTQRKVQKTFIDHGFGFPVRLSNVPMLKVRGEWTPEIDYNKLTQAVLKALAHKAGRLTGFEVKFIRQHFEMTLQVFAKRFGVSHAGVLKWESAGLKPTVMGWATEKDIRLFIVSQLLARPKEIAELYSELEQAPQTKKPSEIECNLDDLAA